MNQDKHSIYGFVYDFVHDFVSSAAFWLSLNFEQATAAFWLSLNFFDFFFNFFLSLFNFFEPTAAASRPPAPFG